MDWKALADVMGVPLEEDDTPRTIAPLEAMEKAFEPLRQAIPLDAPLWNGIDGAAE